MIYLFVIVITLVLLAISLSFIKQKRHKVHVTGTKLSQSILNKKRPLSNPEQTFYWTLLEAFPDMLVLPQVSFSRFLYAKGPNRKENFAKFSRVRQKVADYVLCDKGFNVVGIIELDDSSHNAKKDAERDALLSEAGVTVYRYNVKKVPSIETLRHILTAL